LNENSARTTFKYDVMDRLIEQINFDGRPQRYGYDAAGQLIESEDAGQRGAYQYDQAGRLLTRTISGQRQHQERYDYDQDGLLIRARCGAVNNAAEATVDFIRDALGRITSETQSLNLQGQPPLWRHEVRHGFDELGNQAHTALQGIAPLLNWQTYGSGHLHGITLGNETLIDFERDKLHREVHRNFAGVAIDKAWDQLSRLKHIRAQGQEPLISHTVNRQYHYDRIGQITRIETARGSHQYQYDQARRLTGAIQPGLEQGQHYRFDPAGNRLFKDAKAPPALTPEQERERWSELVQQNKDNPNFNLLQPRPQPPEVPKAPQQWLDNRITLDEGHTYRYDKFGSLIEKTAIPKTVTESTDQHRYRYDANQRLSGYTHETGEKTVTAHYVYDAFGRRIARQMRESDQDGKPIGALQTTYYGWDGDRLILTETDNRHIHTIYEPGSFIPLIRIEGERQPQQTLATKIARHGNIQLDENQTSFFNEVERQIRAGQLDPKLEEHIYNTGNSPELFRDLVNEQTPLKNERIHYYQCDHLGTPIALISEQGTLDWSIELDPWGNTLREYNPQNLYQPIRFQGQHFDEESGLYYNRHRYYEPKLGRYVTQDPIGLKSGVNHYGYVLQDPINEIDPSGLKMYPDDFMGPLPPGGYFKSQMTKTRCGLVPPSPPGVDIIQNMSLAKDKINPFWFRNMVKNNGPWDYKQQNSLYQDFGNFNYGATGKAFGFYRQTLLQEAGRAQQVAKTSRPEWGYPPSSRWDIYGGQAPYGDDPDDQEQINSGIDFCQCMGY
jgi:RHS repeat-associated protein